MNGWQGNNWYELNPSFKVLQSTCPVYTDDTFNVLATPPSIGVYWSGLRIYQIDFANPWGVFLR